MLSGDDVVVCERRFAVRTAELAIVAIAFALVMAGNGLLLTLLGVRSTRAGFGGWETGAVLSGYYVGFLGGARHAPAILRRLGVRRAFGVLFATMAMIAVAPALAEVAAWWVVLRIGQGYAISASYVVMEAYLNGAVDDRRRGRLHGGYMIVTMGAFACGALAYRFTGANGSGPFVTAGAITACGALGVLAARSPATAPVDDAHRERLALAELFRLAPVGVAIGALVGAANGSISSVSVFATRVSLDDAHTAVLSAAGALGPILLLYPISAASDRVPRQFVIAVAAGLAALVLATASVLVPGGTMLVVAMFVAGGLTVTLYTLASATSNDGALPEHLASVGSHVVLLYGVGAIVGTFAAAIATDVAADGYFWVSAAPHVGVVSMAVTLGRAGGER